MNKKLAWTCAAALVVGCAVAWWVNRAPVIPMIEMNHTDRLAEEIKDTLATVTARVASQDEKVRTEVRVIRETVLARINALPPDDISKQLNHELALFRGMEAGSGGLHDD